MNKYFSYLGIFIFTIFSFFYTDKAVDIIRRNDPVMKEIMNNKDIYKIESVNANINDDEIIPGINGLKININKSYQNMKKYNSYQEDMLVFEEIEPDISLINKYDKYIISGNKDKREVALIFKLNDITYLKNINNILTEKNILATFFVNGNIIETYPDRIEELVNNKFEIENLGYNSTYVTESLIWTNNLISSITKKDPKFCYTDFKNDNILNICNKNNMYTIKPTISINNYPFQTIKENLANGSIISFDLNYEVIKELPSIISYIKQKGYNIVLLNELISEKRIEE